MSDILKVLDELRLLQFIKEDAIDRERFLDIVLRHNMDGKWEQFAKEFLSDE